LIFMLDTVWTERRHKRTRTMRRVRLLVLLEISDSILDSPVPLFAVLVF
jgi:hypothetical protein